MAEGAQSKKLLYHLTDLKNLPSIIQAGLLSRRALHSAKAKFSDHADAEILTGRAEHGLDAYVPFHFIQKNPFDYAVLRKSPSDQFVLIAVARQFAATNGWQICPRHPLTDAEPPMVLTWQAGLAAIDWAQMDKRPRNYNSDRECKLVCMAEALSPAPVPSTAWQSIFVATTDAQKVVQSLLSQARVAKYVNVNAAMFPEGAK
jgi:hypothetical protein